MKKTITTIATVGLLATLTCATPALAQQASHLICPSGFSLIGEFCISDKTGDIVLPSTDK
jgi:hypothetical protein